jgi:hypothetical protein
LSNLQSSRWNLGLTQSRTASTSRGNINEALDKSLSYGVSCDRDQAVLLAMYQTPNCVYTQNRLNIDVVYPVLANMAKRQVE